MSEAITRTRPNADQMDELIAAGYAIAGALSEDASGAIKSFRQMQQLNRLGILSKFLRPGDLIPVNKESGISTTVVGSVTTAAVNETTFLNKVQSSETHAYEFLHDGAAWRLDGETVELAEYGVTITGSASEGAAVVVHVQADKVYFESADFDYDVPANASMEHSATLISRDILSYGAIPFSSPQALKAIAADEFPDGMPAGKYHITLDHGCYDNTTKQDGSYQFTTTQPIPVGGKIRHTSIGGWQDNAADYTKAKILAGTFTTYDANYNVIESGLVTTEGSDGTSLGTATAETRSYMVGSHLNSTRRQAYGSNRAAHSAQKKWLNSDLAGAASGAIASWWSASDEFDMPVRSTLPGFKHGLDPEFVACIGPVRKRTLLHSWDRTEGGEKYEDSEESIFQLSMTELGYGNNDGVAECSPKADGTINKTGAYALYVGATNTDRIKRQNGVARYWFHRSPSPSNASNVRNSYTDGALNYNNASSTGGVVAGLNFI